MKITKNTTIGEAILSSPNAAEILIEAGMGCVGCPMAQMETIEEGCSSHGLSKKEIDEIVKKLNK